MRFSVLALVTALVLAPAGAGAQPTRARAQWPVGSAGALLHGSMLYVLTPRLEEVIAIDVAANEMRWRTPVQDTPALVGHELAVLPSGTLVLHAGDQLHVFDQQNGAIMASHPVPMNGIAWNERAHLWSERGVCAIRAPCAFQLVDCTDGAPIGAPFAGNSTTRYRADGTPENGCWSFDTRIVRRHGDHLQIVMSDFVDDRGQLVTSPTALTIDRRNRNVVSRNRTAMPRAQRARPRRTLVSGLVMARGGGTAVLRRADGSTLAQFPTDAWIIGEHVLTTPQRQAIVIVESRAASRPGTLRRYVVPVARAAPTAARATN
jgi:hypothetical protein